MFSSVVQHFACGFVNEQDTPGRYGFKFDAEGRFAGRFHRGGKQPDVRRDAAVVHGTLGETDEDPVPVITAWIHHTRWHGFAVFKHHEGKLRAFHANEVRMSDAGSVAVVGFHHLDVEFTHVLTLEFSVQDVPLHIRPRVVPSAWLTGFNQERRCGLCDICVHSRESVDTMLAGWRLERVLPVRRMQGEKGNAGAMAVGHLQQFWVNFRTRGAPCGRDFFDKQCSPASLGGHGLVKRCGQAHDGRLDVQVCKQEGHNDAEKGGWVDLHAQRSLVKLATSINALIPCFVLLLRKALMRARSERSDEDLLMADHWVENHKRDSWRKQAKASGYRARSAFKLKQIQERFNLVREGDYVLDVGCHPGGWAQVAVELVGEDGKVIGVDLQSCAPVEGAVLLTGDITDPITQERILGELEDEPLNVIVSDISPHITGKWDMDQSVAMTLVADVFDFALPLLKKGGGFTTKLFQGIGVEELISAVRPHFSSVRRFSPDASRNSSSEVYLVCKHHTPWKAPKVSVRERYETAVNKLVGGDEIEDDPEPVASSFRVRRKKSNDGLEEH